MNKREKWNEWHYLSGKKADDAKAREEREAEGKTVEGANFSFKDKETQNVRTKMSQSLGSSVTAFTHNLMMIIMWCFVCAYPLICYSL